MKEVITSSKSFPFDACLPKASVTIPKTFPLLAPGWLKNMEKPDRIKLRNPSPCKKLSPVNLTTNPLTFFFLFLLIVQQCAITKNTLGKNLPRLERSRSPEINCFYQSSFAAYSLAARRKNLQVRCTCMRGTRSRMAWAQYSRSGPGAHRARQCRRERDP